MDKEQNRKDFPDIARVVDLLRKKFKNVKVEYAKENGKEVGKK